MTIEQRLVDALRESGADIHGEWCSGERHMEPCEQVRAVLAAYDDPATMTTEKALVRLAALSVELDGSGILGAFTRTFPEYEWLVDASRKVQWDYVYGDEFAVEGHWEVTDG